MMRKVFLFPIVPLLCLFCFAADETTDIPAKKIEDSRFETLYRYSEKVISGAQPNGATAFEKLKELGVKTIISVDGARPDLENAKKYGMRYIHLPIGYDDIPEQQALLMAKAVQDATEPVFFHCHHGKHRGPSAAAMTMVLLGDWQADTAVNVMKNCGTGAQYKGLYARVENTTSLPPETLRNLDIQLPEVAEVEPMVAAMVDMQHVFDHLLMVQEAGWRKPEDHPDLDPPHEALMLREHIHEFGRTDEVQKLSKAFQGLLTANEKAAQRLEDALREWKPKENEEKAPDYIEEAFAAVDKTCKACHAVYRNTGFPQSEENAEADESE